MQHIKDASFESEVLRKARPSLVVFHAAWSPTSEMSVAMVSDLRESFGDLVQVVGLDVDTNPMTPCQYGIEAIPCFLVIRGGQVIKKLGPGFTRSALQELFEVAIATD